MALEIEFLEGPPPLEVGARVPIRVVQAGADGRFPVQIADLGFTFQPLPWGRVVATEDPGIATLEVVQLAPDDDVLLAPTYTIHAHLAAQTGQTFQTERRIRLVPQALEIELAFAVGEADRWVPFALADLSAPIDWSLARVGDPTTQRLFLREGRPILRVEPPDALPAQVDIAFPNGETASLSVEGPLGLLDPRGGAGQPDGAAGEGSLVQELQRLRRYVESFANAPREGRGAEGIRTRVRAELSRVDARLAVEGPRHPELRERFDEVVALAERTVLARS